MLKFFKGKDKGNLIYAPCKGRVVPLAEVPDPVKRTLQQVTRLKRVIF